MNKSSDDKPLWYYCGHSGESLKNPDDAPCCGKCDPETGKCTDLRIIEPKIASGQGRIGSGKTYKNKDTSIRKQAYDFNKVQHRNSSHERVVKTQKTSKSADINRDEPYRPCFEKIIKDVEGLEFTVEVSEETGWPEQDFDLNLTNSSDQEAKVEHGYFLGYKFRNLEIENFPDQETLTLENSDDIQIPNYTFTVHDKGLNESTFEDTSLLVPPEKIKIEPPCIDPNFGDVETITPIQARESGHDASDQDKLLQLNDPLEDPLNDSLLDENILDPDPESFW